MKLSCLLVSHNKPQYVEKAIQSVIDQEYFDWELVIMDSGILFDNFIRYQKDKRIRVYKSNETPELKHRTAMAPWCFNECFRRNLVSGELVSYLCDDDVLYSNAFSTFNKWFERNPNINAIYASIDLANFSIGQDPIIYGERRALEIGGSGGYQMDCRVDYLQLCHRKSILNYFEGNDYWPEGRETEKHADGVFMEKIGRICNIYPVPIKIGQNRRTPNSTYYSMHKV